MKREFKYSIGNKKIGTDTLIFNMGPAATCPSKRLGLCQVPDGKCYAPKAERMYQQVLPYRNAQAQYWRSTSAQDIARDILEAVKHHKNVKYIRVNESGDFYGQEDVIKLYHVAKLVPGVKFYMYTARSDFKFSRRPENLVINGSGFVLDNCFSYEARAAEYTCPGNCRECNLCKTNGKKIIRVEAH